MDSLKLATFFHTRVSNTIVQKSYIKSVTISFDQMKTFGNEYVSISYVVDLNDKCHELSAREQASILETFNGAPYYTFSLLTHTDDRYRRMQIPMRLLEFKHIYLSLTAYITTQFEAYLPADVSIKIQGLDYWPNLNYAEKYVTSLCENSYDYEDLLGTFYEADIFQYRRLYELSVNSKAMYRSQKELFKVTDQELVSLNLVELNSIRRILLSYQVPVKVHGSKTIDRIYIHVPAYIDALRKEYQVTCNEKGIYADKRLSDLRRSIEYLYDRYLIDEKARIIEEQRSAFIKNLPIQEGDILELKNGRLVVTELIMVNGDCIDVRYCVLKNNLQESVRKRTVSLDQVSFYLKMIDFEEHKEHVPIKRLSLLKRWMKKRKTRIAVFTFQSDLVRQF